MKKLPNSSKPDHIGWDLWQATYAWKDRYTNEMIKRGFEWYGEARANLMQHIPAKGIPQAEIVVKTNLTKQAVQQLLDDLEVDDVISRVPNPDDSRRKIIVLTEIGTQAFRAAKNIKKNLELEYRELLGNKAFDMLKASLNKITEHEKR